MTAYLPVGKLPPGILAGLLRRAPRLDERILLGPGIGLDCAIIDEGDRYLVIKSDPITFATEQIGWYAVQVNVNDIATSGGIPRWMLFTLLLPEQKTSLELVENIFNQVYLACEEMNVSVIGGHTEVTYGIDRPIINATLIGEVKRKKLVTPQGARPGDRVLLTKGVPIEATALIAREFPELVAEFLTSAELAQAVGFLHQPGISVLREAQIATAAGEISAMHDPTEGGLKAALWELAEASHVSIRINPQAVPVLPIARKVCRALNIDPLAAIASGALLLTVRDEQANQVIQALESAGIVCASIGEVTPPPVGVWENNVLMPRPERDEVARLYAKA